METDYYERKLKRSGRDLKGCLYGLITMVVILLMLLLTSCKSVKYVPVVEHHTEYITRTDTVHKIDTVNNEKETIIREANKGDSAMLAKYGIQLRQNERIILMLQRELEQQKSESYSHSSDTIIKVDSIQVPYPVEKKLTAWQHVKQDYGGWAIGLLLALVVIIILTTGFWKKVVNVIRNF